MKRKNLEKIIVLGLLLSSSMYSTAWADFTIDKQTNTLIGNENLANYQQDEYELSSFDNIRIDIDSKNQVYGWGKQGGRLNIPTTNLEIIINSNRSYSDGVRLFGWETEFEVNDYHVEVYAPNSDGLNLDHGGTPKKVQINGDFTAIIQDGSAVRANSSTFEKNGLSQMNTINIEGNADITLLENSSAKSTAIWAGDSQKYYYLEFLDRWMGSETKGQGTINLNGDNTNIALKGDGNYGIWAGRNGTINVNSNVEILATSNNSYGIAATNGNISYSDSLDVSLNRWGSTVTLNGDTNKIYMVETDENGNIKLDENGNPVQTEGSKAIYADSQYGVVQSGANGIGNIDIVGDIEACNGGTINLAVNGAEQNSLQGDIIAYGTQSNKKASVKLNTVANMKYQGDALAANGGVVDVTLGDGSVWNGRADDYQDAASSDWSASHAANLKTKFSGTVTGNGTVNVDMGTGSIWNVTGQSWITNLKGENNYIIMDGVNTGGYALHIEKIENANTFVMNVRPNATGDMLYIKDGTGAKQDLVINNSAEVLEHMDVGDAVRFATVTNAGRGFNNGEFVDMPAQTFGRSTRISDAGIFNVDFDIAYNDYKTEMTGDVSAGHDEAYNGNDFTVDKPGDAYVDKVYGKKNAQNVYIVRKSVTKDNQSDAGKTIINMSRANYKNAIYMDRLNKRMGEMRYVDGEEEQGLWVRLRHDRIGQSGDFRSMNTMYELGYDVKQPATSGEHRIGMAIDYMNGSTTYDDILGKGETKRYGLWLYDTWLGEKGHYTDYIVKWGHLSNDFDISAKTSGEKISGEYSNNVFSVSAEYGKKNDMGNNWYFEPQAQLQLARVTGADYVTTQGSKVSVDGINSLIGRAGFRIGRDMNENSTVYLKADLLHEFMGDQTVTAADATGTLREEFDNKGTWYDVGFGFAAKMSKNSYAFLDFERSFGNDNDETYQINAGLQWSF
jgi:outer membrane autotransporter protein